MKSRHAYAVGAILGLAFAVLIARVHAGPQLESQRLTLRLENEKVRVLELRLKPGEQEGFHTHPQYVLYALTNYRVKNTAADGTSKVFERKAGDVFWGEPITHRGENVGDTEVHALIVELRQSPRPPISIDPSRAWSLTSPPNNEMQRTRPAQALEPRR